MNKKLLSYIAAISFSLLTIYRFFNILSQGLDMNYIGNTAAFAIFAYYNFNDEYKSRGLFLGATIYLIANVFYMIRPSTIYDYIGFVGIIVTFLIFYKLYANDRKLLHQAWFLPALLILISFLGYDIFYFSKVIYPNSFSSVFSITDLIKYLEPIGLFFMCLDTKEWY